MNEYITPTPDPLDELLRPLAPPRASEHFKAELWERTCRVLRWRRRRRRMVWAAVLAGCYFAGVTTPRVRPLWTKRPDTAHQVKPAPEQTKESDRALALEWQAFDSKERRPDLYREAGDKYLKNESDPESALRCYGAALDSGDDTIRAVSPDDSWLLMAIKDARQREKRHATSRD
jgi:hypothetical protein